MNTLQKPKRWYVKELSKLTHVSVKTLHHYDKIGLLKPSLRLPNAYRLYSESDLLKLQQILALKFLGFELSHIKKLMLEKIDPMNHLCAQKQILDEKANALQEASRVLGEILENHDHNKSIPWETIINLIEVYRMTKELEHKWVANVLNPTQPNPTQLKEYANFEQGLKTRFTPDEEEFFHQKWEDLIKDVQSNLDKDPTSDLGIDMGKRCMEWVKTTFSEKHTTLRTTLWEKGFKGGYSDTPSEVVAWLDKATSAYHKRRIYGMLDQVETLSSDALLKLWNDILTEMCGSAQDHKDAIYEAAFADDKISAAAKTWLKSIR